MATTQAPHQTTTPAQLAAATAVAAAAAAVAAAGWAVLRRPLPQRSGTLSLAGLGSPVALTRDRWGVPHIAADSLPDLVRAQGFAHAEDRLWQMDLNRRVVAGRVAEIVGEPAVQLDRWMRTLGLRVAAQRQEALLGAEERELLEAYAAGVNARIARGRLPLELRLLRYRPEPWTPVDSLSWVGMMAWTLSVNWETEILRARLVERLGPARAAELEPPYARDLPYIVPPDVDLAGIGGDTVGRSRAALGVLGLGGGEGVGSNAWAVSGSRTASGRPLLANDMHLAMGIPSVWYENHLMAPGYEVSGVTFPGIPGIVAGHNTHVAWGFTNGFADVQDLYVEHLRRDDDGRLQYETEDGWRDADVRTEVIRVRGREPAAEQVVETRHGPVVNVLTPDLAGDQPLALRWTAYEPSSMLTVLLAMNRATSCGELREALREWHCPVQNVVYADVHGDIGYTHAGRVPVRAKGDGRLPVPGWTGEYEWTGWVPYERLPSLHNPPSGYVVTANNRVVDDRYPYWLGADFVSGNRARRITEMVSADDAVTPDALCRMQQDQESPGARTVAGHLGRLESDDPAVARWAARFRAWDGRLAAHSAEAAVYEVLLTTLAERLLRPRLGDLTEHYLGRGITPVLAEQSLLGERCREWLLGLLDDPRSWWFDLGAGETRDEQLAAALASTLQRLSERLGPDEQTWAWGRLHSMTLRHALGVRPPLDRLLNRGPYPLGGDCDTVWNSHIAYQDATDTSLPVIGPPFRFVADLADLGSSLGAHVPGQSGQVASRHYADGVAGWLAGRYHRMPTAQDPVEEPATRVVLLP